MGTAHLVGAGIAGLACATRLAAAGWPVVLYEASGHAGGRCRSFHDARLGCVIDNGNHLVLGGNRAVLAYLERIGGRDRMIAIAPAAFPFLDLRTGTHWVLRPGTGPGWLWNARRRVPGTRPRDYLSALALAWVPAGATVTQCLASDTPLFERLWAPLAVAALNTQPEEGSARLLWSVLAGSLLRGEAACRPHLPAVSLAHALVDPALARLAAQGARLCLNTRVRALEIEQGRVSALVLGGTRVPVGGGDAVVLAVPPAAAAALLPGLVVPQRPAAILNAHYRLPCPVRLPGGHPFLGLTGGTAEWLFVRGNVASVTVSAADRLLAEDGAALAVRLWRDIAPVLGAGGTGLPPWRLVKERRATFAATPADSARRPGTPTHLTNLFLAGDWIDTGLPATLEGAVRSGDRAAAAVERLFRSRSACRVAQRPSHRRGFAISERA